MPTPALSAASATHRVRAPLGYASLTLLALLLALLVQPSVRAEQPPGLVYSTYLGEISSDYIHDVALDSAGNAYMVGWTYSNNLGGFPNTVRGFTDAFVAKLNPQGSAWEWVTYLGGSDDEEGYAIAVGNNGEVWVTGYTESSDFPTTPNAHQRDFAGYYDVILVRLNAATGAMTYSTLFGYDNLDRGRDVALDGSGNVYVTGILHQANVLALKMTGGANPTLAYGVQWGDDYGQDEGHAIAVSSAGQAYITGKTENAPSGSTFPLVNPLQSSCGPYVYSNGDSSCTTDAFISVLNAAGTALTYSTLLGGGGSPDTGSGSDEARGIALDGAGNFYVTGFTFAGDFPTVNAAFPNYPDPWNMADGWVAKFPPNGQTIHYATYLGAESYDEAQDLFVDAAGNAFVVGYTRSEQFPVLNPLQGDLATGGVCYVGSTVRRCYDAFFAQFTPGGALAASSYLGGGWDDYGYGITRAADGSLFVSGVSDSNDFPTTAGAAQPTWGGNEDGFLSKIGEAAPPPPPPPTATATPPTTPPPPTATATPPGPPPPPAFRSFLPLLSR